MKPASIKEAREEGYRCGNDTSGMHGYWSAWPSEKDMEQPDALVKAWMAGWSEGYKERNEGTPLWAIES
jgi:hypothetical protein